MKKSVKSGNRCEIPACRLAGVIQTNYDIIKAHVGVPIAIGIKVETEDGKGTTFIISLPER